MTKTAVCKERDFLIRTFREHVHLGMGRCMACYVLYDFNCGSVCPCGCTYGTQVVETYMEDYVR